MPPRGTLSHFARYAQTSLLAATLWSGVAHTQTATHLSEEQTFQAARAETDPDRRIASLTTLLASSPTGDVAFAARHLLIETYLQHDPDNTAALHELGTQEIAATSAGPERWLAQCRLATSFAEAEPASADLDDAVAWAEAATRSMTEPAYRREAEAERLRLHLPRTPAAELHQQFRHDRATCLGALAAADLRRNALTAAAAHIHEALTLAPLSPHTNLLRAQLVWSSSSRPEALEALLRASALGPLPQLWQDRETSLFHTLTGGDPEALQQRIDQIYSSLYPRPFALPARSALPAGHPVLLELFTGSDCLPCTAADLAVDSLLGSYTRGDLIALEWDISIPRPDPLATAASEARAASYGVGSTPTAFLDGSPAQILGSSREDTENVVLGLADTLEDLAPRQSPLTLTLQANHPTPDIYQPTLHAVRAHPNATPDNLTGNLTLHILARATVFVALVQDDLRYTGANGVRLHRMVVRDLQQQPLANVLDRSEVPLRPLSLTAVQQANSDYLQQYARSNDRFGTFQFQQTEFPLHQGQLALVAWAEDPISHTVFTATYTPLD